MLEENVQLFMDCSLCGNNTLNIHWTKMFESNVDEPVITAEDIENTVLGDNVIT